MNILQIGILIFTIIEALNVVILYFSPEFKYGNSVGVFKAWTQAQNDEQMKPFVNYMVAWVAGSKLIFIMLGIVIIIWGNIATQLATCVAMILSIASFFWKLYPAILKMDENGEIKQKGYSKTLLLMIAGFILLFIIVFTIGLIQYL